MDRAQISEQKNTGFPPGHHSGFLGWGAVLLALHTFAMLFRYGCLPIAPVYGDEIVINDPAIALSRGRGLIAPSFTDSIYGLDKLYAHFPPVFLYLQSLSFSRFGVSVYSLRLLTTIMSILASAVFILMLDRMCRWRAIGRRTGILLCSLYTLSASTIVLHRMARMESLIEFLSLISLFCVLTVVFRPAERNDGWPAITSTTRTSVALLVLASTLQGICLATHPEALTALLPISLLLLIATTVKFRIKAALLANTLVIPIAIWVATYGSRSMAALHQMNSIAEENHLGPSILRYGWNLIAYLPSGPNDKMRFALFCFSVLAMLMALLRAVASLEFYVKNPVTSPLSRGKLWTHMAYAVAIPITVILLLWFLPASITRYEVMYPIYLVGIAISSPDGAPRPHLYSTMRVVAALLVLLQVGASVQYLQKNLLTSDCTPSRYDSILRLIPSAARVAISPQLWLAFQAQNRPITLLYREFDGMDKWKTENSAPLHQFDVIVLEDSLIEDSESYAQYARQGRKETDFHVGSHIVRLFSR